MAQSSKPTFGNGKICYLEIPSNDVKVSAAFYQNVFNWTVREDNGGNPSFDDGVGEVSGMWVLGRKPADGTGIMISIMVGNLKSSAVEIKAHGGEIIEGVIDGTGKTLLFKDPTGNVFCLYESSRG